MIQAHYYDSRTILYAGCIIEKSKPLLHDASLTIVDIANLGGFEDQSYFTKQFKAEAGISPKKFREKSGVVI